MVTALSDNGDSLEAHMEGITLNSPAPHRQKGIDLYSS